MSKFFIHRPIFAIVISLIIVIAGSIAATQLPIAQYPQISPPTVSVSTSYTGASAAVVNQTVAQIIEDQVNGTQGMDYMSSTSDDTGRYSLSVTFEVGTDGDMDSVKVQNNVASATSQLPSEVQQIGVTTKKSTNDMAYMMSFYSPDGTYDRAFMKNYATIYLLDKLKRINGVGDVQVFGSDYAMRVWLNPDKLAELNLTVADVSAAIKEQNVQAPAGTVGAMPVNNGQEKQMSGKIEGRLTTPEEFGNVIDSYNSDRKSIDRHVTQEAHEIIESDPELKNRKSTVIYNPRWMKGIVGIVSSRLIETYFRPTVVLTQSNGFATGSARSVPGFDLYQAVESCSDLLENFGGHMYAAGLTMRPEHVGEFTRRFNAYVEENIDPQMLVPQVDIDSELLFSDITPAFRKDLNRFQPFGPGNTAPVFATCGVSNHGDAKLVGMESEHLRMDLIQRQKPNTRIQAIAFQQPTHFEWVRSGRPIDVCYQIVENHYRGTVTTQLRIKDIKPVLNR